MKWKTFACFWKTCPKAQDVGQGELVEEPGKGGKNKKKSHHPGNSLGCAQTLHEQWSECRERGRRTKPRRQLQSYRQRILESQSSQVDISWLGQMTGSSPLPSPLKQMSMLLFGCLNWPLKIVDLACGHSERCNFEEVVIWQILYEGNTAYHKWQQESPFWSR